MKYQCQSKIWDATQIERVNPVNCNFAREIVKQRVNPQCDPTLYTLPNLLECGDKNALKQVNATLLEPSFNDAAYQISKIIENSES